MLRRSLMVCLVALLAGCQDYNFNPVGKCVVQPGASRIRLDDIAAADILFVVDDSGSMASKQARLAQNFTAFIDALAETQAERASNGLAPLELHIAVTTSSIFEAWGAVPAASCTADGAGALKCNISSPRSGWTSAYTYTCDPANATCVDVVEKFRFASSCAAGVATDKTVYPAGDFVALGTNSRVLHFTKDLNWTTWKTAAPDARLQALVDQFKANVNVGTCGSGMEQHLEAGRLAVQKAIAGTQPGATKDDWPHAGAKMVVVWVGDEDDCSSPKDPNKAIFFPGTSDPGNDACMADEALPLAQRKAFPIKGYFDYFSSLGGGSKTAFGAAFIYSAVGCAKDPVTGIIKCTPGRCSCAGSTDPSCGGFSAGSRFRDLAQALSDGGYSTLEASVCDADWGTTLKGIAGLVKPPSSLRLPTPPAGAPVSLLRIESSDGSSSRQCNGPAPKEAELGTPAAVTAAASAAAVATHDWWFAECTNSQASPVPVEVSSCVFINHNQCPASCGGRCSASAADPACRPPPGSCGEAKPGESYVAQYLGFVPREGCVHDVRDDALSVENSHDCAAKLNDGDASDERARQWRCVRSPGRDVGTCVCAG